MKALAGENGRSVEAELRDDRAAGGADAAGRAGDDAADTGRVAGGLALYPPRWLRHQADDDEVA